MVTACALMPGVKVDDEDQIDGPNLPKVRP